MNLRLYLTPAAAVLTSAACLAPATGWATSSPGPENAALANGWREAPAETRPSHPDWRLEAKKADSRKGTAKAPDAKSSDKNSSEKSSGDAKKPGKPSQVGTYGDWGVFVAQGGKEKTCYALATPKERAPAKLKRDPAYVFISNRPGESVRSEVSVIMGFAVKPGADVKTDIGGAAFDFVPKGSNAWIKNTAEEGQFVDALKKGSKLIVKAPSAKGNVTTDSYSLSGLSQALERVQKECP
ncbi:invasion associated locus B family protein [Methylocapsa palsarum]|nr:invasion associated locus B family protein [Methylocapsa palsarum]